METGVSKIKTIFMFSSLLGLRNSFYQCIYQSQPCLDGTSPLSAHSAGTCPDAAVPRMSDWLSQRHSIPTAPPAASQTQQEPPAHPSCKCGTVQLLPCKWHPQKPWCHAWILSTGPMARVLACPCWWRETVHVVRRFFVMLKFGIVNVRKVEEHMPWDSSIWCAWRCCRVISLQSGDFQPSWVAPQRHSVPLLKCGKLSE